MNTLKPALLKRIRPYALVASIKVFFVHFSCSSAEHHLSSFMPLKLAMTDAEGDMARDTDNLLQYFATRTENAPLLRRRQ